MTLWNAKLTELLLTAPNPRRAAEYWANLFGGEVDDDGVQLAGDTRLSICDGPRPALAEVGFDATLEVVAAALRAGGTSGNGTTTVTDPDGWVLRLAERVEVDPQVIEGPTLSHCTLNSPAPSAQNAWYESLGFLLSDRLGEIFYWLRPNPIHHAMAFSKHGQAAIHHLALELPDVSALIGAIDRVVADGGKLEFGPGRHMVGGNLFAYLRDSLGVRWELCAELGRLDPDRPPGIFTAEDRGRSVNTFGPPPPPSFIEVPGGPPPAGPQR